MMAGLVPTCDTPHGCLAGYVLSYGHSKSGSVRLMRFFEMRLLEKG